MKGKMSNRLYAGSAMGASGKTARKAQFAAIIVILSAITVFSGVVFFGRFLQDKQEDQRCYVFSLHVPDWYDDIIHYVGPEECRTFFRVGSEEYDVRYNDGVILSRPELPKEYSVTVSCRKVRDFGQMMKGTFLLLPVCFVIAAVAVILNYRSFYRPTKSIYLMKRLRSSRELHRRCLTIPLTGLFLAILLCIGLGFFYYWIYRNYTLPVRLPDRITFNVWRTFI